MRVVVPAESKAGEKRVALLPDIISKLTKAGLSVSIESGAGIHAGQVMRVIESKVQRYLAQVIREKN